MGNTAYPTGNDLGAWLLGHPMITSDMIRKIDLDDAAADGVETFETAVGRTMLAVKGTRTFDPPKPGRTVLQFHADVVAITAVTLTGQAQTLNVDYFLHPENADNDGKPWAWIEFANPTSPQLGARKSVSVAGSWGYGTTIPGDAWHGMIAAGALHAIGAIRLAITQGLVEWKEADVSESYGQKPLQFIEDQWTQMQNDAIRRYRRVTMA